MIPFILYFFSVTPVHHAAPAPADCQQIGPRLDGSHVTVCRGKVVAVRDHLGQRREWDPATRDITIHTPGARPLVLEAAPVLIALDRVIRSTRFALLACALFTAAIGAWFWWAWRPGPAFFAYNLPLAPPLAAFLLERAVNRRPRWALALDGAVVALALARVFIPPFPFVSGHALFTGYAALTARGWVLRASAGAALVISLVIKLVRWGDWKTPLGALALAVVAALLRTRIARVR